MTGIVPSPLSWAVLQQLVQHYQFAPLTGAITAWTQVTNIHVFHCWVKISSALPAPGSDIGCYAKLSAGKGLPQFWAKGTQCHFYSVILRPWCCCCTCPACAHTSELREWFCHSSTQSISTHVSWAHLPFQKPAMAAIFGTVLWLNVTGARMHNFQHFQITGFEGH